MTDGLDQALAQVPFPLLTADPLSPALTVLDGFVPDLTPVPYVLLYTTVGRPPEDPDRAGNGRSGVWMARWYCHCVAATAMSARAIAQRVRTQLLDVRPTVAGLSCGQIRWEDTQPPQRDESTGTPIFDLVEVFWLKATN